jgi:hypothetical protein
MIYLAQVYLFLYSSSIFRVIAVLKRNTKPIGIHSSGLKILAIVYR